MGKPKKYEERLMAALGYDEDDLDANAAGHFSDGQRADFTREQRRFALFMVFDVLMLVVWVALARYIPFAAALLPFLYIAAPIVAAMLVIYGAKIYRLRRDLREDTVLSVEGRVDLIMQGDTPSTGVEFAVQVGSAKFPVKKAAFLAFKNGDPYTIYHSRLTKKLLSVEWLRENDDNLLPVTDIVTNGDSDEEADAKVSRSYS